MKHILLLVGLSICILMASTAVAASSGQVKIINSKNNEVLIISDEKQLNQFLYFWSQKQPIDKQHAYDWDYQLIFQQPSGKSQWVYDRKGYAREISLNKSTIIYQLIPIRSFNRFLNRNF